MYPNIESTRKVFLSYDRGDLELARTVYNILEPSSRVWFYPENQTSSFESLRDEIKHADAFVIIASPGYVKSPYCQRELSWAWMAWCTTGAPTIVPIVTSSAAPIWPSMRDTKLSYIDPIFWDPGLKDKDLTSLINQLSDGRAAPWTPRGAWLSDEGREVLRFRLGETTLDFLRCDVTISDASGSSEDDSLFVMSTPLTRAHYRKIFTSLEETDYYLPSNGWSSDRTDELDFPKTRLSLFDARRCCDALSHSLGLPKFYRYPQELSFRLLTTGEWSCLAAQHLTSIRARGLELDEYEVFDRDELAPVGTRRDLNGFYDFFGNICEWVEEIQLSPEPSQNIRGSIAGGSWRMEEADFLRALIRRYDPVVRSPEVGCRPAFSLRPFGGPFRIHREREYR